ncbi:MAG: DUF4358 domain-containing protein [Clostridia bacterium]|nr:DUF4358 domain-containing protein [Clostridia bacterium]
MKYKLLSVLLASALAVTVFAACGKGPEPDPVTEPAASDASSEVNSSDEATSEDASSEEASSEDASSEEATTEEPTTEAPTTEAPTTEAPTTEAPTTEAPTTEAPTTEAPTTEAPTTEAPKPELSAAEVASAIVSRVSFGEPVSASAGSIGAARFGLSAADYSDIAYYAATAAVTDEVLVVKLSSSAAAANVNAAFAARQAAQIEDYEDYVPTEVPKLENAVMYRSGDWMVFCVSADAAAARGVIANVVG